MAYKETYKRVKTLADGVYICELWPGCFAFEVAPDKDAPNAPDGYDCPSCWGREKTTIELAEADLKAQLPEIWEMCQKAAPENN